MAQETCAGASSSDTPRENQDRVGIVEGSCGYRVNGVNIRGKFVLSNWVTRRGGRHFAKRSHDPRQAYPDVKLQGRDLVRVEDIVAPFVPLGAVTRENHIIEPKGGNRSRRRVPSAPSSGTPRESKANFRVRSTRGL